MLSLRKYHLKIDVVSEVNLKIPMDRNFMIEMAKVDLVDDESA